MYNRDLTTSSVALDSMQGVSWTLSTRSPMDSPLQAHADPFSTYRWANRLEMSQQHSTAHYPGYYCDTSSNARVLKYLTWAAWQGQSPPHCTPLVANRESMRRVRTYIRSNSVINSIFNRNATCRVSVSVTQPMHACIYHI